HGAIHRLENPRIATRRRTSRAEGRAARSRAIARTGGRLVLLPAASEEEHERQGDGTNEDSGGSGRKEKHRGRILAPRIDASSDRGTASATSTCAHTGSFL